MPHSEQTIKARSVISLAELGLTPTTGTDKAVLAFLSWAEAIATRWIQLPAAVVLFATVPSDPQSGTFYLFDRRKDQGVFYALEIEEEANGLLTEEDYERLIREHKLLNLAHRPWRIRSLVNEPKPTPKGRFAYAA